MKSGDQKLVLPAGFRFHPTDEELVVQYLCRKCSGQQIDVHIIAEIDLYKFDPWDLPGMALYGEKEWYFFSPRDRKYLNGSRPNRTAGSGYWKATGADKAVGKPTILGIKKALVFYVGKAPKGIKTNWIMHEYRLANVDRSAGKRNNLRLDDWVLCGIYNKRGILEKHYKTDHMTMNLADIEDRKPIIDATIYNLTQAPMSLPLQKTNEYLIYLRFRRIRAAKSMRRHLSLRARKRFKVCLSGVRLKIPLIYNTLTWVVFKMMILLDPRCSIIINSPCFKTFILNSNGPHKS